MADKTSKPSRTPHLDNQLEEKYHRNPRRFRIGTTLNLIVALGLLALVGGLAYFAIKTVGLSAGGDGLLLLTFTLFLVAVAILDDVRWRLALVDKVGSASPS